MSTGPSGVLVRPAAAADLPVLTDIYNHYIVHTSITFDLQPFSVDDRRDWFLKHAGGRYRLLVADDGRGRAIGYASSSQFRIKAAYDTSVTVVNTNSKISNSIGADLWSWAIVVEDALGDALELFGELGLEARINRQKHRSDQTRDHQVFGGRLAFLIAPGHHTSTLTTLRMAHIPTASSMNTAASMIQPSGVLKNGSR